MSCSINGRPAATTVREPHLPPRMSRRRVAGMASGSKDNSSSGNAGTGVGKPADPLLRNATATASADAAATAPSPPSTPPKYWLPKQLVNQLGYGGCIVLYTLLWWLHTRDGGSSTYLTTLLIMWDVHFAKRCLECLFVHKWSDTRNELFMSVGEWIYYWGFTVFTAYSVNSDSWGHIATRSSDSLGLSFWIFVALFAVAVCGNGAAHLQLRLTRATRYTQFPTGPLFCLVSCPHYSFEVLTWASFTAASLAWGAAAFFVGTLVTLCMWAHERHVKYRSHFDGSSPDRPQYPSIRKALVPFVF